MGKSHLIADANDIAERLMSNTKHKLTYFEAMQIAAQLQQNNLIKEAFGLSSEKKSVLDDIAFRLMRIQVINEKFVIDTLSKKKKSAKKK